MRYNPETERATIGGDERRAALVCFEASDNLAKGRKDIVRWPDDKKYDQEFELGRPGTLGLISLLTQIDNDPKKFRLENNEQILSLTKSIIRDYLAASGTVLNV